MDTLDTRIFRELVQDRSAAATSDVKKSFRTVAKQLGVDEVTVRNRVARMQRSGFLQSWNVIPNPSLFGLSATQLSFDIPRSRSKADLVEQLKLLPGSLVVVDCFGSSLFYAFLHRDEDSLRRQVELVRRMSNATELVHSPIPLPECQIKLTGTDFGIVRAMQKDPRMPLGQVATKVGVSTRTVKRRLQRMIDERAVFMLPGMNPSALEGVTQADLLVVYDDSGTKWDLDQKFLALWDDYIARAEIAGRESSFFNLFVRNISQAQEVLDWAKGQQGVKNARLDLVQNRYELYDSLGKELDRALQGSIPTTAKAARL